MNDHSPVIYLMGCASPCVLDMIVLVRDIKKISENTCVLLSPSAALWLKDDIEEIVKITGFPVRVDYKLPEEPDVLPSPDMLIVAPATFKTMNKWAQGISDSLILGLLNEYLGMDIPKIALPVLTFQLAQHPQWERSINVLANAGVNLIGTGYSLAEEDNYDYGPDFQRAWAQTLELIPTLLPNRAHHAWSMR